MTYLFKLMLRQFEYPYFKILALTIGIILVSDITANLAIVRMCLVGVAAVCLFRCVRVEVKLQERIAQRGRS